MSNESHYYLGFAVSLLEKCREYFILKPDPEGLAVIEDQYINLKNGINKMLEKENNNGTK